MSDRRPLLNVALSDTTRFAGAASTTTTQPIKVIDVSERPAVANVIRDGKQVPAVSVSATDLQNWLNVGVIGPIEDRRRVVTQSVSAGTRVARGTSVDIVLAEPSIIPVGVLQQPHRSLVDANLTVQAVLNNFLADPEIRNAVLDADRPDQIPPATQQRIRTEFSANNAPIDDGDPVRDFTAAFRTLKSAAAFG
jgi:hypothetical protein